jgi:hypothetical protein
MIALSHDARSIAQDDATLTSCRSVEGAAVRNYTEGIFSQWTTAQNYVRILVYKQKPPQRLHRYGGLVSG